MKLMDFSPNPPCSKLPRWNGDGLLDRQIKSCSHTVFDFFFFFFPAVLRLSYGLHVGRNSSKRSCRLVLRLGRAVDDDSDWSRGVDDDWSLERGRGIWPSKRTTTSAKRSVISRCSRVADLDVPSAIQLTPSLAPAAPRGFFFEHNYFLPIAKKI